MADKNPVDGVDNENDSVVNDNQNPSVEDLDGLKKHKDKLLGEVKKLKQKLADEQSRASNLTTEKLEAEGKKDELIAKYKSDLEAERKRVKDLYGNFASSQLESQLKTEALKLGCVDDDAAVTLADVSDLEVDDKTFRADPEKVKETLMKLKEKRPYLFSKTAPAINSRMPSGKPASTDSEVDYSKMTTEEMLKLAHKQRQMERSKE